MPVGTRSFFAHWRAVSSHCCNRSAPRCVLARSETLGTNATASAARIRIKVNTTSISISVKPDRWVFWHMVLIPPLLGALAEAVTENIVVRVIGGIDIHRIGQERRWVAA